MVVADVLPRARVAHAALTGVGVSRGIGSGIARSVRDEAEARAVAPGEIVVAEQLPPGWVPLIVGASGVVAGEGGLLCSAAIVLRESGIPAVMGLGSVVRSIENGCRLTVDGAAGTVSVAFDR